MYYHSHINNVSRELQLTVTGKTGKYLSDVEISGDNYLEIGQETDLAYAVYPKRVAESSNLYITWGMVTGEDKDGNTTYSWATADTPATDGRGQIDSAGHYSVVSGGQSVVVLKAQTGYYLSNNNFYEISSKTATFDMSNGIPVENITIDVDSALGIAGKINKTTEGNKNVPVTPTADTAPFYPDETFTKEEETDLDNGLVIKDASRNEYVWIEVPKSLYANSSYNTETTTGDKKPSSSTDYDKIEYCLHKYTDYYRNGTSYTDTYYSDETTGLTSAQYTELKQKMLKSVYENGGFWIGRYEAGIEKNRTSSTIDLATAPAPLSKKGTTENAVYPYTYVTCSQAQTIASKLSTGKSYTSSLMFGVQWDLVLKHIETKIGSSNLTTSDGKNILTQDSSSWGNYSSSSAKQSGSSETYKKMNIYDLAGNVREWTLEYTASTGNPCALRGGEYGNTGSSNPASDRVRSSTSYSGDFIGFRPSLYK